MGCALFETIQRKKTRRKNTMQENKTRPLVINALVAAIYVVIYFIAPQIAYGPIQFRLSEGLNHLNAFDRRYKWGVVAGVFIANFYGFANGLGWYDLVFGTFHTVISFLICDWIYPKLPSVKARLGATTVIFSLMIFIVAFELNLAFQLPFWYTYFTLVVSELIVLAITAPLMYWIDRQVHFHEKIA